MDNKTKEVEAMHGAGKIVRDLLGGTRRMRMPMSVMMFTGTFAAIAEIQSPMGTKCRNTMTTRTATTKRNANAMTLSIKNPPINPFS